ncbi:hypothetical protein C7389_101570 [Azoarcus indigens]|uniref:Uncharacterized protein n=1 Tax=Azoarcus indigens TaxID=29545 RepID=A0A4R6EFW3_9RHOO|nr:hypothetical protein C7389_101570 [Azoarcus indigens]
MDRVEPARNSASMAPGTDSTRAVRMVPGCTKSFSSSTSTL